MKSSLVRRPLHQSRICNPGWVAKQSGCRRIPDSKMYRKSILRMALLIGVGTAVGLTVVPWITQWSASRQRVAQQAEYEARRLSVNNPPRPESFFPEEAVPRQRPLVDVEAVAASDVGDRLGADELILGVVLEGQPRAYPINMMTGPQREIFNDTLADRPIAATW